jgi:hypothetical protein
MDLMQISEGLLKVCRIGLPTVHPRGGIALEHEERFPGDDRR